jgi:hypothetical protein
MSKISAPDRYRSHLQIAAFLLPCLVALPILLLIWQYRFDGLYGQDAYAYYRYATGPLRESLLAWEPLPPFFWPPGYPLLVALLSLLTGIATVAGQVVSLVAGSLVPVATALLARALWPPPRTSAWMPLFAGVLVALTGQLWQSSAVIMSDTTALAMATGGAWALANYGRSAETGRPDGRWLLLAAAGCAYAVLSRWAFALVAIPCAAYALYLLAHFPWRVAAGQAAGAALAVLVVLSPIMVAALQGQTALSLDQLAFVGDLLVVPWEPGNALLSEFTNSDGLLRYRYANGLYYALAPAHRYFFTPVLALLLLPGLYQLWVTRKPGSLFLIALWPAVVFAFLAGAPWQNFRFTLTYLPPLAIIAALGAELVARRAGSFAPLRALLVITAVSGLIAMASGGWTLTESFIARKNDTLRTMAWVEHQIEPDSLLFTFSITATFQQYSQLEVHDLFLLTPKDMSAMLARGEPAYLLADVVNVQQQWAGRSPARNKVWLEEHAGLTAMGKDGALTLFRVGNHSAAPSSRMERSRALP